MAVDNHLLPLDATATALGANGVYSGPAKPTKNYGRIVGTVFANVAGSLAIQQSADGQNWDAVTTVAVSAGVAATFSVEVVAPWVQIVYTNGAGAQATFRLNAFLRMFAG